MKTFSRVLTFLGAALLILTAAIAFGSRNASPRLLNAPEEARVVTQELMEDLSRGDLAAAGLLLSGQPVLENTPDLGGGYADVLWNAYWDSFQYAFAGDCYAGDNGLCRDVTVTVLDIPALLPSMESTYQTLLPKLAAAAGSDALDSSGGYREDFVLQVLERSATEALAAQLPTQSRTLTLRLACRDGQWQISCDKNLTDILSGGLTGKEG